MYYNFKYSLKYKSFFNNYLLKNQNFYIFIFLIKEYNTNKILYKLFNLSMQGRPMHFHYTFI